MVETFLRKWDEAFCPHPLVARCEEVVYGFAGRCTSCGVLVTQAARERTDVEPERVPGPRRGDV